MHQSGITCAIYFCTFSHIIAIEQLYKAKRVAEAMMKMLSQGDISVIRSKVCSAVISTNRSTNLWKIHLLLGFYKISNIDQTKSQTWYCRYPGKLHCPRKFCFHSNMH